MRPESTDGDLAYVWDMLQAARDALDILGKAGPDAFARKKSIYRGVERCVELIGEAAKKLSNDFRARYADVPWQDIIGQRNILAHDYGRVDYAILYKTVTEDIPSLIARLEALLPEDSDSGHQN